MSPGAGVGSSGRFGLSCFGGCDAAGPEAEAVVSSLKDVAVMRLRFGGAGKNGRTISHSVSLRSVG